MEKFFDFADEELQAAYAEEAFIADVQYEISRMLKEKQISRSELARRMSVSPAYISQLLGDEGANLTSRTIAKIFFAIGETPTLCAKARLEATASAYSAERRASDWFSVSARQDTAWSADDTLTPEREAATNRPQYGEVVWLERYRKAA